MEDNHISRRQLKRIQTLWGLAARAQAIDKSQARDARLAWISSKVGRNVNSCNELTRAEAKTVIDAVQRLVPPEMVRTPDRGRDRARGQSGRTSSRLGAVTQLPDAQTLATLQTLLDALGWDRARLDLFLHSPKSPVRHEIRTLAAANKIIWVLKSMLRRRNRDSSARSDGGNSGPDSRALDGHDRAAL